MSTISLLRLWNDPGFTDGCVEVPAYGNLALLPIPDVTIGTAGAEPISAEINPSKGRLFSELKLKRAYSDCQNLSYLEMTVDYNTGTDRVYYGFIDSVEIVSDTDEYPAVLIKWHVDLWRTYLSGAVFGYGMVRNRPSNGNESVQNLPYRFRQVSREVSLSFPAVGSESNWLILCYTVENTSAHTAETHQLVMPISQQVDDPRYWKLRPSSSTVYRAPSLNDIIEGEFDEKLGIVPTAISGAFVSAIPPLKIESGTGTNADPYVMLPDTPPSGSTTEYIVRNGSGFVDTPLVNTGWCAPQGFLHLSEWYADLTDGSRRAVTPPTAYPGGTPAQAREWWINNLGLLSNKRTATQMYSGTNHNDFGTITYDKYVFAVDDLIRGITGGSYSDLPNGSYIVFDSGYCDSYTLSITDDNMSVGAVCSVVVNATTRSQRVDKTNGAWGGGYLVFDNPANFTWHLYTPVSESLYQYREFSHEYGGVLYGAVYSRNQNYWEYPISVDNLKTTEAECWTFTDRDGTPLGVIPWGMTCAVGTARCVVSSTSAYIQFRFSGLSSSVEGLQFSAPLPAVDLTSNSWSDYLYSGQREYDVESRKTANEIALMQGLVGALGQGATGAMLGGLKESQSFLPSNRSIANASMFGLLGAGASAVGAGLGYMVSTSYNDRLQSLEDERHARQIDSLVLPGSGWDWLFHGRDYMFVCLSPDGYSLDRYESQIALNGVDVQEPTADCTALIHGVGPLRIENLIVRGNIPAEAKQYIKQKINNGVRLI